eukprot:s242_g39.t1
MPGLRLVGMPPSVSETAEMIVHRALISDCNPDRVHIIVTKAQSSTLPEIQKKKFLMPGNMKCGAFKYIIHTHVVNVDPRAAEQHLSLATDGPDGLAFLESQAMLSEVYDCQKADGGFLYITYLSEDDLMRPTAHQLTSCECSWCISVGLARLGWKGQGPTD